MTKSKKFVLHFGIGIALIVAFYFLPGFGRLSSDGVSAIGLMLSVVWFMSTNVISPGLMCFIIIAATPLLGLTSSLTETANLFTNSLLFFIVMAVALGAALQNTTIIPRVLLALINRLGGSSKRVIQAIWLTTILVSALTPNLASVAMMVPFAFSYLDLFHDQGAMRKTGKGLMIGLYVCVELGGSLTPLGSGINMVILNFLAQYGYSCSFAQWLLLVLPVDVIMFFVLSKVLFTAWKPSDLTQEDIQAFKNSLNIEHRLNKKEISLVVVYAVLIFVMIVFPSFDAQLAVILAAILLVYPIQIIDWKDIERHGAFSTTFCVCIFILLANLFDRVGIVAILMDFISSLLHDGVSLFAMLVVLGVICVPLSDILPGQSIPTVLTIPIILLSESLGFHPILAVIPVAMFTNSSWLIPTDAIAYITYEKGHYTVWDMFRVGIIFSILFPIIVGASFTVMGKLMGFM